MAAAVEVRDVSKRFRLYQARYYSLKERIIHFGHNPYVDLWALRGINLVVDQGETVGLIGHNGSGKSTLLKCIAAILHPTEGQIRLRGNLAAMLELGAGFSDDLSGRDNIFLNASLLGVPRREIERRFDAIVAFAELEQFIDNQVKFYSSGMQAKLGFAVAVSLEPDVLLIDEVLAVGDENFQRKCIDRIRQFQTEGRTIVFVSHDVDLVRQLCDSAFVLGQGRQVADKTTPGEAIRLFREYLYGTGSPHGDGVNASSDGDGLEGPPARATVKITSVDLEHPGTGARRYLLPGEPLTVRVGFAADAPVHDAVFTIGIRDHRGELLFGSDTEALGQPVGPLLGSGAVLFHFEQVPLLDGTYPLILGIRGSATGRVYDWQEHQAHFEVMNPGRSDGMVFLSLRAEVVPAQAPVGERRT